MCLVCKDWQLGKLTTKEALRNLNETVDENATREELDHYWEIATKITDAKHKIGDWEE